MQEKEGDDMTLGEFKAWLDGYMDDRGASPNAREWKKIKKQLESVQSGPCDRDHYWPYYSGTGSVTIPCGNDWQPSNDFSNDFTSWHFNTGTAVEGNGEAVTDSICLLNATAEPLAGCSS
jgi:hypothetical protein